MVEKAQTRARARGAGGPGIVSTDDPDRIMRKHREPRKAKTQPDGATALSNTEANEEAPENGELAKPRAKAKKNLKAPHTKNSQKRKDSPGAESHVAPGADEPLLPIEEHIEDDEPDPSNIRPFASQPARRPRSYHKSQQPGSLKDATAMSKDRRLDKAADDQAGTDHRASKRQRFSHVSRSVVAGATLALPSAKSPSDRSRPRRQRSENQASRRNGSSEHGHTAITSSSNDPYASPGEVRGLDGKDELLQSIADHKPASQPVEDYLNKNRHGNNETLLHLFLLQLVKKHGYDADWTQARPMRDYVNNDELLKEDWEALPQQLEGDELGTAQLKEYWRTCNTSPACRNFIRRALTNDGLAKDYDLKKRITTCLEMIRRHPRDDQALWRAAPAPERYLCGRFGLDETWPLTYQSLRDAWNAVGRELTQQDDFMPPIKRDFDYLYQWARIMFKHKGIHLVPIEWPDDVTIEDYIRNDMTTTLRQDALCLLKPLWDDAIRGSRVRNRQSLEQQFSRMQEDDQLPRTIELLRYDERWDEVQGRFAEWNETQALPHRLRHRLRDFKSMADKSLTQYGEPLYPPGVGVSSVPAENLDDIGQAIRRQSLANHNSAWQKAIADADDATKERLQNQYSHMRQAGTEGFAMWRPNETQPPDDFRLQSNKSLGFGSERSGIADQWNFKCPLGKGGNGQASLWVKLDPSMNVTERMVVEDVYLDRRYDQDRWEWDLGGWWYGPKYERQPIEEGVPTILKTIEDSDKIVCCRGAGIYDKPCMYRLYSEYCPHGDLQALIEAHLRARDLVTQDGHELNYRIPERALWAIFEALVTAVCLMHLGRLPGTDVPGLPVNRCFLHCDIKPANVFLAPPDEAVDEDGDRTGMWPGIPVPKLGDFGNVRLTDNTNQRLPSSGGTFSYEAPEQCPKNKRTAYVEFASDIWAIGRTMHCLVNLSHDPRMADGVYTLDDPPDRYPPRFFDGAEQVYTNRLLGMIANCLAQDPARRPDIYHLWRNIHLVVASFKGLRGPIMKKAAPEHDEARLLFKQDTHLQWT